MKSISKLLLVLSSLNTLSVAAADRDSRMLRAVNTDEDGRVLTVSLSDNAIRVGDRIVEGLQIIDRVNPDDEWDDEDKDNDEQDDRMLKEKTVSYLRTNGRDLGKKKNNNSSSKKYNKSYDSSSSKKKYSSKKHHASSKKHYSSKKHHDNKSSSKKYNESYDSSSSKKKYSSKKHHASSKTKHHDS